VFRPILSTDNLQFLRFLGVDLDRLCINFINYSVGREVNSANPHVPP
jgi:hypothetical protein